MFSENFQMVPRNFQYLKTVYLGQKIRVQNYKFGFVKKILTPKKYSFLWTTIVEVA